MNLLGSNEVHITYTFKYQSDSDSIDLNTLLLSQIHLGSILNEIKNEVAADTNLKIKIKPLEKGSVPFDFILGVSWIDGLFSTETIAYASGIVTVLVGLIQLRIWLKGRKPTYIEIKGNKVMIVLDDTTIEIDKTTYELYDSNSIIDNAMQKSFEAIESDEDVTGVEILDKEKKPLITISREQFSDITTPNQIFDKVSQVELVSKVKLTIFKVVFDKGYKWQFYIGGRKISASINDDAFMERINHGERFAKGDVLLVDMRIEREFDKTIEIYIDKEFAIIKVIEHIPRPQSGANQGLFKDFS